MSEEYVDTDNAWEMPASPKTHRRVLRRRREEAMRQRKLDLKELKKTLLGNDRWLDLLRSQRGELLDQGLITPEEYAQLVMTVPFGAAGRLSTYDMLIRELEQLRKEVRRGK